MTRLRHDHQSAPDARLGTSRARTGAFVTPVGPLSRTCPKCEAAPGMSCRRWVGGRVCGEDVGGGYWKSLKNPHPERAVRRKRAS